MVDAVRGIKINVKAVAQAVQGNPSEVRQPTEWQGGAVRGAKDSSLLTNVTISTSISRGASIKALGEVRKNLADLSAQQGGFTNFAEQLNQWSTAAHDQIKELMRQAQTGRAGPFRRAAGTQATSDFSSTVNEMWGGGESIAQTVKRSKGLGSATEPISAKKVKSPIKLSDIVNKTARFGTIGQRKLNLELGLGGAPPSPTGYSSAGFGMPPLNEAIDAIKRNPHVAQAWNEMKHFGRWSRGAIGTKFAQGGTFLNMLQKMGSTPINMPNLGIIDSLYEAGGAAKRVWRHRALYAVMGNRASLRAYEAIGRGAYKLTVGTASRFATGIATGMASTASAMTGGLIKASTILRLAPPALVVASAFKIAQKYYDSQTSINRLRSEVAFSPEQKEAMAEGNTRISSATARINQEMNSKAESIAERGQSNFMWAMTALGLSDSRATQANALTKLQQSAFSTATKITQTVAQARALYESNMPGMHRQAKIDAAREMLEGSVDWTSPRSIISIFGGRAKNWIKRLGGRQPSTEEQMAIAQDIDPERFRALSEQKAMELKEKGLRAREQAIKDSESLAKGFMSDLNRSFKEQMQNRRNSWLNEQMWPKLSPVLGENWLGGLETL